MIKKIAFALCLGAGMSRSDGLLGSSEPFEAKSTRRRGKSKACGWT